MRIFFVLLISILLLIASEIGISDVSNAGVAVECDDSKVDRSYRFEFPIKNVFVTTTKLEPLAIINGVLPNPKIRRVYKSL